VGEGEGWCFRGRVKSREGRNIPKSNPKEEAKFIIGWLKNKVGEPHKSQQDFTRMEFTARQCGDLKKGLYVTQELLTGL